MKNTKSILFLGIAVATMALIAPVLFVSGTACAQQDGTYVEQGYDKCGNGIGWSESKSAANQCGWPVGSSGYIKDCCCCYTHSHIHDLGKVFENKQVSIEYRPGLNKGCCDTMIVYSSINGQNWNKILSTSVEQETWSPKTTYEKTIKVENAFRYIKIHIPKCFNDYSSARIITLGQDECDYVGQTKCYDSTSRQVCGNYDSDSWLEWSSPQNCEVNQICENGECVEECTSHYTKKCYDNDLYWYDSCNGREGKYQECGSDYWTNNYQCSGNWTQKEKINQTCSNNACANHSIWENYQNCSDSGKTCSAGTCVEQGQNECSYVNQHECSGTSGRTCGNYDSDSWLEWSLWNNCDTQCYHCGDGACDSQCGETSYNCANDCGGLPVPINHAPTVNAGPNKETYGTESVVLQGYAHDPDGDPITYLWSCDGGSLSNPTIAQPIFYAPYISSNSVTYTCALRVYDNKGLSGADIMNIWVREHESPTLYVSARANPNSGCAPLNDVDITANVSGTANGNATFFFDCTNDGSWEKITSNNSNSYTAYNLCNYPSEGRYTAKVRVERDNLSIESTTVIDVSSTEPLPSVDIKANNSDHQIFIPYNTSATLKWTSSNVEYCFASGDWEGSRSLMSNSWSTGDLTSSKTYTIGCRDRKGISTVDTVVVNVASEQQEEIGVLTIEKTVRNVSDNTGFGNSISADPGETISFTIIVKAIDEDIDNIIVKDTLPDNITYTGNLKVSGKDSTGNIFTGLDIGHISEGKKRTITFTAKIDGANNFNFGETSLINAVIAYNTDVSVLDTAKVVVNKKSVLGAATSIKTGAIDPIQFALLASLLVSTLLIISLFILHKILYPRNLAWQKMVDKYQNLRFYAPFLP